MGSPWAQRTLRSRSSSSRRTLIFCCSTPSQQGTLKFRTIVASVDSSWRSESSRWWTTCNTDWSPSTVAVSMPCSMRASACLRRCPTRCRAIGNRRCTATRRVVTSPTIMDRDLLMVPTQVVLAAVAVVAVGVGEVVSRLLVQKSRPMARIVETISSSLVGQSASSSRRPQQHQSLQYMAFLGVSQQGLSCSRVQELLDENKLWNC
mmetsp:Transcript_41911/g.61577  ORF Transcript_41911/g.61577 Transcript_41911/m.61577 type:complete len:206 (+) Transcript_41911:386-1003(+)